MGSFCQLRTGDARGLFPGHVVGALLGRYFRGRSARLFGEPFRGPAAVRASPQNNGDKPSLKTEFGGLQNTGDKIAGDTGFVRSSDQSFRKTRAEFLLPKAMQFASAYSQSIRLASFGM